MKMPFSPAQFFENMTKYNLVVFPMQIFLLALALFVVFLVLKPLRNSGRIISGVLAFFWLWMGAVYQIGFFSTINKGAYGFGALFLIQGVLFAYFGTVKNRLSFHWRNGPSDIVGIIFIIFALVIYPLIGFYRGRIYSESPTFGLPCPTTIFTFGMLLFSDRRMPVVLFIIPFLWSILGYSAALYMGVKEDFGLLVAGIIGTILLLLKRRHQLALG